MTWSSKNEKEYKYKIIKDMFIIIENMQKGTNKNTDFEIIY